MTAFFPQDRTMLLVSFTIFMALETALGSALRDFRSYAAILAGYTVGIISIADLDAPLSTFSSAVNRVAAICVGIVAIALTNFLLATTESSQSLMAKLRLAYKDLADLAGETLERREAPVASQCVDLAARLMPLRSEISYATPEKADGRRAPRGDAAPCSGSSK